MSSFYIRKEDNAVVFAIFSGRNAVHCENPEFPLDEKQMEVSDKEDFLALHDPAPKLKAGKRYRVLRDISGTDNCFNYPKSVTAKAGTVLVPVSSAATRRGHLFLKGDGITIDCREGVHLYGPYGEGHYDPRFFKPLD